MTGYGPNGAGDIRFTRRLVSQVAVLLTRHGYPAPTRQAELDELDRALRRFLYSPRRP